MPLTEIVESLQSGRPLDSRSVAITFDDAYESIYSQARNWPFTIFVSTDAVDRGSRAYLTWEQLRTLTLAGASIGNHSRTHGHLIRHRAGESTQQWRARVRADIEGAQMRLQRATRLLDKTVCLSLRRLEVLCFFAPSNGQPNKRIS